MSVVMDRGMPRHKINVDEYYRMAEEGLLAPDARVELIEGEIIPMPPIGVDHAWLTDYIGDALKEALAEHAYVRVQSPVNLNSHTVAQPDVTVAKGDRYAYRKKHPSSADILLAVEVSDTSIRDDRKVKLPLYAINGFPEFWIVDVQSRRIEIFREPKNNAYRKYNVIAAPTLLTIERLPGLHTDLSRVFEVS
jgi:Uma2 family endonuclease